MPRVQKQRLKLPNGKTKEFTVKLLNAEEVQEQIDKQDKAKQKAPSTTK